jgi:hypothetical protein
MDKRTEIVLATAEPFALRARQVVDALREGELGRLAPLVEELQDALPELVEEIRGLEELDLNEGVA